MTKLNFAPCPFCGKEATEYLEGRAACDRDDCSHIFPMPVEKWNRRFIEDTLRARIEKLEIENDPLRASQNWRKNDHNKN